MFTQDDCLKNNPSCPMVEKLNTTNTWRYGWEKIWSCPECGASITKTRVWAVVLDVIVNFTAMVSIALVYFSWWFLPVPLALLWFAFHGHPALEFYSVTPNPWNEPEHDETPSD